MTLAHDSEYTEANNETTLYLLYNIHPESEKGPGVSNEFKRYTFFSINIKVQ